METPEHLKPLMDGTPLAVERIEQAWPGLSFSDRAYLLSVLLADRSKETMRWNHHVARLINLALQDDNAYIRYLAAKHVFPPSNVEGLLSSASKETDVYLEAKARDEMAHFEKVQSDPVILVRLANEERNYFPGRELDDPASFWERPQLERLALINGVQESGDKIANLLRYATKTLLPNNPQMEFDMLDVLLQYLGGKTVAERVAASEDYARHSYDGFAEYFAGQSVKALWELIPDIPKVLSYPLIECLPERAGFQSEISPNIIESLDDGQLERLLLRDDIGLQELRRKIYKGNSASKRRHAAMSSEQFRLLDSDISELLYSPEESVESGKKKVAELEKLATHCRGATLVQMQAICALIEDAPRDFVDFGVTSVADGEREQTRRAQRLSPSALQSEILDMRIFAFAMAVAPIKDRKPAELPEELMEHKDLIVGSNPWQTYLNLRAGVPRYRWKKIIGYLPEVYIRDFDLPDEPADKSEVENDIDRRELFDLLQNVQGRVKDVSEQDRAELSTLGNALSELSNQTKGAEIRTGKRLESIEARVAKLATTANVFFWVAGAVLLLVLFK